MLYIRDNSAGREAGSFVKSIPWPLRAGNLLLVWLQESLNRIFPPRLNPMYNLGPAGYFFLWVLLGTGVYLYLFYDMSLEGAYRSVRHISEGQRYYGGIIRSVHRYASAGLMAVTVLHLLQTFFSDRFRKYRWVAWVTGVVILPFLWLEGATGYAMVFDEKGKMAAIQFARWMDAFPLAVEPFSRNFIPHGSLNSLFFYILTYMHLTVPAFLLIALWVHCMRISRPLINVPRQLAIAFGAILVGLAAAIPAASGPPADISRLVKDTDIDWFYLFPFPAVDAFSASMPTVWGIIFGVLALLTALPWLVRDSRAVASLPPVAVNLAHCTGCEQCVKACPFEAIDIKPRSDGRPFSTEVEIVPGRCASCGLCVPACPFPALTLGKWDFDYFEKRVSALLPEGGKGKMMVFVCERSLADLSPLRKMESAAVMEVPCVGILGARSVAAAMKTGVDGVAVAGCVPEDCHFRLSQRKLDITRTEISGIKRLKTITVSQTDPEGFLARLRTAHRELREYPPS